MIAMTTSNSIKVKASSLLESRGTNQENTGILALANAQLFTGPLCFEIPSSIQVRTSNPSTAFRADGCSMDVGCWMFFPQFVSGRARLRNFPASFDAKYTFS